MAVIVDTEDGCVLDHGQVIDEYVKDVWDEMGNISRYRVNPDLFDIHTRFLMDSQVMKPDACYSQCSEKLQEAINQQKRRKRKRNQSLNSGELSAMEYHEKVRRQILTSFDRLMKEANKTGYFRKTCDLMKGDNNMRARLAGRVQGPGETLVELCQTDRAGDQSEDRVKEWCFSDGRACAGVQLVNTLCHYTGEKSVIANIMGNKYILPPQCSFLLSDISFLHNFTDCLGKFDLVVMDPPWNNKSVKRQKKYYSLTNSELFQLPVQSLTAEASIVAVWVTNKQKHIRFVQEELFPSWSVAFLAQWFWVKVTRSGEMVYDFDSPHKKPYEALILGRRYTHIQDTEKNVPNDIQSIPTERTIISIPCSLHSKKPPVDNVLRSYFPSNPRCLELFARNLMPGWTSWGNEVLLHQHLEFFKPVT